MTLFKFPSNSHEQMLRISVEALMRTKALYLILAVAVAGFFSFASPSKAGEAAKFKVGLILNLNGPAADYGLAIKNGVELARKEHPELFTNIEFVFEDTTYDSPGTVSAFNKLRNIDKVDLIYVWGLIQCEATAPLAEAFKTPLLAQCVQPKISKGRKYVVRFFSYSDQYARTATAWLAAHNLKKIGLVVSENGYLEEMRRALEENLQDRQNVVLIERHGITDYDFRSTVTKAARQGYDVLAVYLAAGQIAQFYRQMHEQHLSLPTIGTNFFGSTSEIEAAAGKMDGALYPDNIISAEFITRYEAAYGNKSQITWAAFAYEFADICGRLFHESKKRLAPDEVMAQLALLKPDENSVVGPAVYEDSPERGKQFSFPIAMKQIQGREGVTLPDKPQLTAVR